MKILHIVETCLGGCGTYLNEVIPLQIESLGVDNVKVLAPAQHASHLTDIDARAIEKFNRPRRLTGLLFLAKAILETVRNFQPDIIHAHSTFAGAIIRSLPFRQLLPPIIYCAHGWVFETSENPSARKYMKAAERLLASRCYRVVAISEAERLMGIEAGIPSTALTTILNGVRDLPQGPAKHPWLDPRLKVLFVGRLDRQKGVDLLLEAVKGLETEVTVRIVGSKVLSSGTVLADQQNVQALGWMDQDQVADQMRACDVVVMPSRWEGFGLVAIEAMRLGKPVLAARVGGLSEIVIDNDNGNLFPVENSGAIRQLLRRYATTDITPLGQAGRKRFLEFYARERTHAALMALYQTALAA